MFFLRENAQETISLAMAGLDDDDIGHAQKKSAFDGRHHGAAAQVKTIAVGGAGEDPQTVAHGVRFSRR
jgi:hypothetical protein